MTWIAGTDAGDTRDDDFEARVRRTTRNLYAKLVRRGDILLLDGRPFCSVCGIDITSRKHGVSHYVDNACGRVTEYTDNSWMRTQRLFTPNRKG